MNSLMRLVVTLTLVAGCAGLILSLVEQVTRAPIAEQRRMEMLRALQSVLPEFDNQPDADRVKLVTGQDKRGRDIVHVVYRGRKQDTLTGLAFKVTAADGYSGNIDIMLGIRPDGTVEGVEVLTHNETPGLGDKIELPSFRAQFAGKNLGNVDWRVKKDGGEFDQLTGATISPRAIVGAVRAGLEFYRDNQDSITTSESIP
ncbi:MAG: NADH:ubiquinone oxidoreductase subunit RnfG [Desulfuromonas sp.]|nr:MAG: NADH:ubiquinone oxidoreductase subunit RnfG [Desulfuromonas sp.]